MAANFDSEIAVQVNLDAPPIEGAGFGVVLLAALSTSLQAGFSERVRFYESAQEAADDADLSQSLQDAVDAAFAQGQTPAKFAIGRLDALTAEVTDVTIDSVNADGDGSDWKVDVGDLQATYTQQNGDTAANIASGLQAAIDALANASAAVAAETVTITGENEGQELNVSVTPAGSGTATVNTTSAATTVADGLDAIVAEESNFYGLCLESRDEWNIMSAAGWAETNKRLLIAQSSDSDVKSTAYATDEKDVASKLKQASYTHTALLYYSDDNEWADVAWAAGRLAVDPDRQTTIWMYATLAGIPVDSANVTSTDKSNILSKSANVYLTFYGQGAAGEGTVADGTKIDLILTADWLKARGEEKFAQILLDAASKGQKVPYTDAGLAIFSEAALGVLSTGVNAGHFAPGTPFVDMPELADVSDADRSARKLSFSFGAEPAGAIESVSVTGYVSLDI